MEKFSRIYNIVFTFGTFENGVLNMTDEKVTVEYPLTVDLAIGRSVSYFTNTANLIIYGLDETKRKKLAKDRNRLQKYIRVEIYAGYDKKVWLVYRGGVDECFSFRQGGETEFRTVISSSDASIEMLADIHSTSFNQSTDAITKINNIASNLVELKLGVVSPYIVFPDNPERGQIFTDRPLDILGQLANIEGDYGSENVMNIDMGKVNFLQREKDVIKKYGVLKVNDETGLLGTPVRRESILSLKMLFEPAANLNQMCLLDVKTLGLKGIFKVMSVSHDGTISGAKCGSLITTLDLFLGLGAFNEL